MGEHKSSYKLPQQIKNVVIYHGECDDGFAASFAAWTHFKNDAVYLPMNFGGWGIFHSLDNFIQQLRGKNVYILDFSFSLPIYRLLHEHAESITLLDHHETAREEIEEQPGCIFMQHICAANMAWEFFNPDIPQPKFFSYIEDSDLCKYEIPETKDFIYGLRTQPRSYEFLNSLLLQSNLDNTIQQGKIISAFMHNQILDVAEHSRPIKINNKHGMICNGNRMIADELHTYFINQNKHSNHIIDFVLLWYKDTNTYNIKCIFRACTNNTNVANIAKSFNGGGNYYSAGCRFKTLDSFIQDFLDVYLEKEDTDTPLLTLEKIIR